MEEPPARPTFPTPPAPTAPWCCRRCGQPCRGHKAPTGVKCRTASCPPVQPIPEHLRAPSCPPASLKATPATEVGREMEAPVISDPPISPLSPPLLLPALSATSPPDNLESLPYPSLPHTSTDSFEPSTLFSLSTSQPLPLPLPLTTGQYKCKKCFKACKDTGSQPFGCEIEDLYGDLVVHPALVQVWPVCCSD